jgi:putative hydrolase of the HAD superfamily
MIDAVLFEFDGVIADTRVARRRALTDTIERDGITLTDEEYGECCSGLPVRAAIRAAFALRGIAIDETGVELAGMRADRRFAMLVETGISLMEGAQAAIEALQGTTRLGIVSRAARQDIEQALNLAQLDHAFEFIIADDDAFPPKPSPAQYAGALERLARRKPVVTRNVVALEDGAAGIRAAKAAGLRCAVVGDPPMHLALDADALIPSLVGLGVRSLDLVTHGVHGAER